MKTAEHRHRDNLAFARWRLGQRRVSGQSLVRTGGVIVVFDELAQEPLQVSLIQHDDVVQ